MVAVADTVKHLRRLERSRQDEAARRRRLVETALPRAREILVRHGAEVVLVFGSIATGSVTPDCDLDLATSGLPSSGYFPALGALMTELPVAVDLVRLEEAPCALRERIAGEGREL